MQPTIIAGRYAVERAVGRGGMGTVWLCRDEVLGRHVAVKQVGSLPGETASAVDRALREARSSAALNHPHVVAIYDAVEDDGHHWLVMEYVESRTLAQILEQEGPMRPERAAWIGVQAADGLAAAHARGTMHRDVKPSNILVTADDHVKITDFGIARTDGDLQLTQTGFITGTPAYFAPETARGEAPGLAADVWALGASLYAAVEGRAPYPDQGNALAMLTAIATQAAPLPRQAGVLTETINRMMDRDPTARWSMAHAAQALRQVHEHGADHPAGPATSVMPAVNPSVAPGPPPGPPPATGPGPRRHTWALAWVGVLLLAAVAFGVALLIGGGDDAAPVDDAASTSSTEGANSSDVPSPSDPPTEPSAGEQTEDPDPPAQDVPPGDVEAFGRDYYALLPGDTASAYELLSPSYGSTLEQYDAFWSTIEAVEVVGATAVDDLTVDVTISYLTTEGGTDDETRRLFLEQTDDGLRIVDDEVV